MLRALMPPRHTTVVITKSRHANRPSRHVVYVYQTARRQTRQRVLYSDGAVDYLRAADAMMLMADVAERVIRVVKSARYDAGDDVYAISARYVRAHALLCASARGVSSYMRAIYAVIDITFC